MLRFPYSLFVVGILLVAVFVVCSMLSPRTSKSNYAFSPNFLTQVDIRENLQDDNRIELNIDVGKKLYQLILVATNRKFSANHPGGPGPSLISSDFPNNDGCIQFTFEGGERIIVDLNSIARYLELENNDHRPIKEITGLSIFPMPLFRERQIVEFVKGIKRRYSNISIDNSNR